MNIKPHNCSDYMYLGMCRCCAAVNDKENNTMATMTKSTTYATGQVITIIDNDRLLRDSYYAQAKMLASNAVPFANNAEEATQQINAVAMYLREAWEAKMQHAKDYRLGDADCHMQVLSAIMQAGFNEVNWHEVAIHLLAE